MRTIRGPGIFLARFIASTPPFDSLDGLAGWPAGRGFRALQVAAFAPALVDVDPAAASNRPRSGSRRPARRAPPRDQ